MIAYYFGWFAAALGLLIGWAATKGYELFGGRPSKAKVWIVVLAVIVVVFVSFVAEYAIILSMMISSGELLGFTNADIPAMLAELFRDPEIIFDVVLGYVFAILGCVGLFRNISKSAVPASRRVTLLQDNPLPM